MQSRTKTDLTTTYAYDALGRRIGATDLRTGTAVTHYDTMGRVGYLQDAAGNTTVLGYDDQSAYDYDPATGGLIFIDYSDATVDITFDYDRLGMQTQISDGLGTRTFAYNTALQPETETMTGLYDDG